MMNWYVVYTKPKWEKKVAEQLKNKGIACYCPCYAGSQWYGLIERKGRSAAI
jgi:hypothetical protein